MAMMQKYRIHEVAKDFKTTSKVIGEIMTKYFEAPKNHMQILEDRELNVIFERLTQDHQVQSVEELYAVPVKEEPKAAPVPAAEKPAAPQKQAQPQKPQQTQNQPRPQQAQAPVQQKTQNQPQPQPQQPQKERVSRGVPEKRVIDTSGVTINIAKYDEHLDTLVPDRAAGMKRGKEKFPAKGNKNKQNQSMASSAKRRQEERDRIAQLHGYLVTT